LASDDKMAEERGAFLDTLEALLRPLMPIVLTYQINAQHIGEVFRTLYIESLAERLREQGLPATSARLAVMAGLNRGEVDAILGRRSEKRELRGRSTRRLDELANLLAAWHDDSRFSTPYGAPLDLSLQPEGSFKTFSDLATAVGAGINWELLLDELLSAGCVEVHADKFVRCVSRVFIPTGIDVSRIARLGRYVAAFNRTLVHNLLRKSDEESDYERAITTSAFLRTDFRNEAQRHLLKTAEPFAVELDRWFESQEADFHDPKGSRFGLCMFFFEEPQAADDVPHTRDVANVG